MNKVTLPKEVAEAIETFRTKGYSNFNIMRMGHGAIQRGPDRTIKRWAFDDNGAGNPDLLMSALVNGYEVEKSPEDKLRDYWIDVNTFWNKGRPPLSESYYEGSRDAIITVLGILGIKIEGINADSTSKEAGE